MERQLAGGGTLNRGLRGDSRLARTLHPLCDETINREVGFIGLLDGR